MNQTYVYLKSEPGVWTVGFYLPDGTWEPESDYNDPGQAADRVRYLNGGTVKTPTTKHLANYEDAHSMAEMILYLWEFEHRNNPPPQDMCPGEVRGSLRVGWNPVQGFGRLRLDRKEDGRVRAWLEHRNASGPWEEDPRSEIYSDPHDTIHALYDRCGDECFFEALHYELPE